MASLPYKNHRLDPDAWAQELGITREAIDLYLASEPIDLHIDSFIWNRVFGYDLTKRHGRGLLGGRVFSQVDFPRAREAALAGGVWVITTNPFRPAAGRAKAFFKNLEKMRKVFAAVPDEFAMVRNISEYRRARSAGKHAAFVGVQGGNGLDGDPNAIDKLPEDLILLITPIHFSRSRLGDSSLPTRGPETGLTSEGKEFVQALNAKKIFVDLAHISRRGFFDAMAVHDKSQPLMSSHTGVSGVRPHWRNLDDEQLRAIAGTGGLVGIMYQASFLSDQRGPGKADSIVDHLAHVVDTIGEDHACLGSDWDGAIVPPRDLVTCLELPRLVELMLKRGWSSDRIQKIMGGNFLRVLEALRG